VGSNPARGMAVCDSVLCCPVQVKAFATGRSLVQRSPTVCLNRLRNLRCEAAKVLTRTVVTVDDDITGRPTKLGTKRVTSGMCCKSFPSAAAVCPHGPVSL
jgi:hypothetical protein